jgi:hypothetical protein
VALAALIHRISQLLPSDWESEDSTLTIEKCECRLRSAALRSGCLAEYAMTTSSHDQQSTEMVLEAID